MHILLHFHRKGNCILDKGIELENLKFTKEQFNYTIALAMMEKYYKEGKITKRLYEKIVEKYESKTLAKGYRRC